MNKKEANERLIEILDDKLRKMEYYGLMSPTYTNTQSIIIELRKYVDELKEKNNQSKNE